MGEVSDVSVMGATAPGGIASMLYEAVLARVKTVDSVTENRSANASPSRVPGVRDHRR